MFQYQIRGEFQFKFYIPQGRRQTMFSLIAPAIKCPGCHEGEKKVLNGYVHKLTFSTYFSGDCYSGVILPLKLFNQSFPFIIHDLLDYCKIPPAMQETFGKVPRRRERLLTPVFRPGEFHGLYSLWGCKKLDTTERHNTFNKIDQLHNYLINQSIS